MQISQDFLRRLPEASRDLRRKNSLWHRIHIDPILLALLLALAACGLIVLYSASDENTNFLRRQAVFFALAFATMWVVAQVNLNALARWSWLIYLFGLILLVAVLFLGEGNAAGVKRWLSVLGIRFQPSEIIKLALPIVLSAYLAKRHLPPRIKNIAVAVLLVLVPAALIREQPDFGTAGLISIGGLSILFLAGISWRYIVGAVGLVVAAAWPYWQFFMLDYQKERVLTLLNPEADKWGAGWNIIQSKTAIGSGGVWGKGWMQGTQSHLDFLPESHTDFIVAVLAEEYGLIGVCGLMILYFLILMRGMLISVRAQDSFGRLLAGGLTVIFFVYVFVNMGMVAGLLPVVGAPLPLVSYGGTALVTLMMGFGLLMAISTQDKRVAS